MTVTVQASYEDTRAPVTTRWISITTTAARSARVGCAGNTDAQRQDRPSADGDRSRSVVADMPISAPGF